MATRRDTASAPPPLDKPKTRQRRNRLEGWWSGNQATAFAATNLGTIRHLVEIGKIRTRQLPGEKHPKYNREDLEKVVQESVKTCSQ